MNNSGFLHQYFLNNGAKRLHKWLHYFDIYEHHFARFRARPVTMLEIGVHGGGSLEMWNAYFHPQSTIVGIDINPECQEHARGNIKVHIGSQDDPAFLRKVCDTHGPFDIILDDGSHMNAHIITSFDVLYPRMASHGVYFVEDVHTAYWAEYGGGLRKPDSFIEYAKSKIDELNASHSDEVETTDLSRTTTSISFYDSAVVFERAPQGERQHVITGPL